jgi:hypothetical protein
MTAYGFWIVLEGGTPAPIALSRRFFPQMKPALKA